TIGGASCKGSLRAVNPATGKFIWEHCMKQGPVVALLRWFRVWLLLEREIHLLWLLHQMGILFLLSLIQIVILISIDLRLSRMAFSILGISTVSFTRLGPEHARHTPTRATLAPTRLANDAREA